MTSIVKLPKVNYMSQSQSQQSVLLQSINQTHNLQRSQENSPLYNTNIFNPIKYGVKQQLSSSRYSSENQNKWIINKLDNNTDRIVSSYKKDQTPLAAVDQSDDQNQQAKTRRRRMVFKSIDASYLNSPKFQEDLSPTQMREKLITPPENQYIISPLKKRSVKRQNLYIQSNTTDEQITNQSDNFDEMTNSISTKESIRSRQESLSQQMVSNLSDVSLNKSQNHLLMPFFSRNKQPSIAVMCANTSSQDLKSPMKNESEDSNYNFTNKKKRNISILPPINKGILKNISETTIVTKRTQKKTVSFKCKTEDF